VADPDIVIDGVPESHGLDAVLRDVGLRAAEAGRVVRIPDDAVLRPGPSMPAAALALARQVAAAAGLP